MQKSSGMLALITALTALTSSGAWAAAASSSDASEKLEEVTVTAHRAELQARVAKFVNEIAARGNDEGLPRWQTPVCPIVSGLPRPEGEFILARISEIARAAAVPLAGEKCRPNLYILVHPQPRELLLAMQKRNFIYTFGRDAYPTAVDEFIATPRPVRVWYNASEKFAVFGPNYASRLRYHSEWELTHVFVVVDQTRLRAVARGQLADYVALVSLAQLKPDARLGDAPTILKLFDGTPEITAAGMTDWDQAFLKSLYATDQISTLQRSQMAHQIVREVRIQDDH